MIPAGIPQPGVLYDRRATVIRNWWHGSRRCCGPRLHAKWSHGGMRLGAGGVAGAGVFPATPGRTVVASGGGVFVCMVNSAASVRPTMAELDIKLARSQSILSRLPGPGTR